MAEAHVFVDQIEGSLAVLVEDAEEYSVPLQDLPEETEEGDWLTVQIPSLYTLSSLLTAVEAGAERMPNFVLDKATGEAIEKRVQSLMDELSG